MMRDAASYFKWGRCLCLPLFLLLVIGCSGVRIEIETGGDEQGQANTTLIRIAETLKRYDIATDAYTELFKNTSKYNYPFLRDYFKLKKLRDYIAISNITNEGEPIASSLHRRSAYNIEENRLSIAFMVNDSVVQLDVVSLPSLELVNSGICNFSEKVGIVSSVVRINDSLYVLGVDLDEDASMYWVKLQNGSCLVQNKYTVLDIIKSLNIKAVSEYFEVIDLLVRKDTLYALVYVQSSGWDSSTFILLSMNPSGNLYGYAGNYILGFSTIEGTVKAESKIGLVGRRGAILPNGEVISLDPFAAKIRFLKNNTNLEIVPHLNPQLYDSLHKLLVENYYAFTCFFWSHYKR